MRTLLLAGTIALSVTGVAAAPAAFASLPQSQEPPAQTGQAIDRPPPRRRALLIGVTTYRPADYQPGSTSYAMMRNLPNTCRGAEAIGARLQALGWSYDPADPEAEVQVFCDTDTAAMTQLLRLTVADFDRTDDFLLIYMAGHGAEIEGRNYFFGPQARIDVAREAERLERYAGNPLFVGHAVEIGSAIFATANLAFRGNVLLILDTCSNDIVYETLGARLRRPIGAPQTDVPPLGVSVFFANTPGKRISDGVGLSHLARAIDRMAVAGLRIPTLTRNITHRVTEETRSLPPDQLQQPLRIQELNNPDICLAGCTIFAAKAGAFPVGGAGGSKQMSTGRQAIRNLAGWQAPPIRSRPASPPAAGPRQPDRSFTVYREFAHESETPVVNADIYWCEGAGERRRAREAVRLAEVLSRAPLTATLQNVPAGIVHLGGVRIRALGEEENARADLRVSGNVGRISEASPHAAAIAATIRSTALRNLHLQSVRGQSDTINIFLCTGVATAPQAPRLHVQVAREDQRAIGTLLSAQLDSVLSNLWVASAVDVEEQRSPAETQVRFFYESDRTLASRIADSAASTLPARPQLVYLPQYSGPRVRPGSTELWIGSSVQPTVPPLDPQR